MAIIDVSSALSVPYYEQQQKPQDISLYTETNDGKKESVSFSSLSSLGDILIGCLSAIRIHIVKGL